jgi:hypothetical protein
MGEKIKEQWPILILVMLITLFGNILFYSFKKADATIENAASIEYVDEENNKQDKRIDKKADKENVDILRADVQYIREQNDDIKKLLIEMKN